MMVEHGVIEGDKIKTVQAPIDHRLKGTSTWIEVSRQAAASNAAATAPSPGPKA